MSVKISKGKYQEGVTTEENSLTANLNKYPEIMRRVVDLHPKYSVTWLFEKLGRFDGSTEIKDNSFEYRQRGRLDKPWVAAGIFKAASGYTPQNMATGTTTAASNSSATVKETINTMIWLGAYHDPDNDIYASFIHGNGLVRFQSGAAGIIVKRVDESVTQNGKAVHSVLVKVIYGTILQSDVAENQIIGLTGNAFGEDSDGGYDNSIYEHLRRGWVSTFRRKKGITGDAFTNVSWMEYEGQRLWYFEQEYIMEQLIAIEVERKLRYSRRSMGVLDQTSPQLGHPGADNLYPGGSAANDLTWDSADPKNSKPPVIGDGLEAQISEKNESTYNINGGLTATDLLDYMARLGDESPEGSTGNEWVVLASTLGRRNIHNALKEEASGTNGGTLFNIDSGKDYALGSNFTTYEIMGNKMVVMHDDVLGDPHLHNRANQYGLKGSGDLWFLDMSVRNGEPNISLLSKQKRSYIKKYIPGMVDPMDPSSMKAAHAGDRFDVEWLGSNGVKLANEYTSGIIKGVSL